MRELLVSEIDQVSGGVGYAVVITPGGGFEIWGGGDIIKSGQAYRNYLAWQASNPYLTVFDYGGGGQIP